jgi:two-component system cell cycle sensor histidine kinase/response regulator CckA
VSEAGTPRSLRGFLIDVTSRRQLEADLRHAQKLEAVGRMAGGIAHDYDDLLRAILGTSELLVAASGDRPRLEGYVDQIQRAGGRAAALTQQLLALSRQPASPEAPPREPDPAHPADRPRRP